MSDRGVRNMVIRAYFSPVNTIEATICFWKAMNRMMRGTSAMVVADITYVQLALYWDCRAAVATVITLGRWLAMTRGHMKEFHWLTTVMRVSVARMGRDIGRTT